MKYHGTKEELIDINKHLSGLAYVPMNSVPLALRPAFREYLREVAKPEYKELSTWQAAPAEYWRSFLASDDFGDLIADIKFSEPATPTPATSVLVGEGAAPEFNPNFAWERLWLDESGDRYYPARVYEGGKLLLNVPHKDDIAMVRELLKRAARPAPLSLLGSGDAADALHGLRQRFSSDDLQGELGRGIGALLAHGEVKASQALEYLCKMVADALPAMSAAASTGGGAAYELPAELRASLLREASRVASEREANELRNNGGHGDFDAGAGQGRAFLAAEILAAFPVETPAAAPQHLVVEEAAAGQWISVDERLPEEGRKVWVAVKERHHYRFGGAVVMRAYTKGKPGYQEQSFADNDAENIAVESVSHWMYATVPPTPTNGN